MEKGSWMPKTKRGVEYAFKIKAIYDSNPSYSQILFISRTEGIAVRTVYAYLKFAGVSFAPPKRNAKGRFSAA